MCVTIAVAGLAASLYSANQQQEAGAAAAAEARIAGQAAMYEGAYDKEMRGMEAEAVTEATHNEYDQIRTHAYNLRSQAMTAQSGSGVAIGEGSAQAAVDQIETLATADALAALYSGVNKSISIREQGKNASDAGQQSLLSANRRASTISSAANSSAVGTALGGAVKYGGGIYQGLK